LTYGYIATIKGQLIAWTSRVTPTVAHSTAEAEYVAIAELLKELLHLRSLLQSLGINVETAVTISTDSRGAKGIAEYQQISKRSKHIELRYHAVREKVRDQELKVLKVLTSENIADIFTKGLGPFLLAKLLKRLMNLPYSTPGDSTIVEICDQGEAEE
jgi:hypothetical protein